MVKRNVNRLMMLAAVASLACWVAGAGAMEYFISPTGNDAGAGTEADPWASPSRGGSMRANGLSGNGSSAVVVRDTSGFLDSGNLKIGGNTVAYTSKTNTQFNLAAPLTFDVNNDAVIHDADLLGGNGYQPGDIITLRGGTYLNQRLRIKTSGTGQDPITYRGFAGEDPLIEIVNFAPNSGKGAIWNDGEGASTKTEFVVIDNIDVRMDQNGFGGGPCVAFTGVNASTVKNSHLVASGSLGDGSQGIGMYKTSSIEVDNCVVRSRFERAIGLGLSGIVDVTNTVIYDSKHAMINTNGVLNGDHLTIIGAATLGVHLEASGAVNNSIVVDTGAALSRGTGEYNLLHNNTTNYGGSWAGSMAYDTLADPEFLVTGFDPVSMADPNWLRFDITSPAATAGEGGTYVGAYPPIPEPATMSLVLVGAVACLIRRKR